MHDESLMFAYKDFGTSSCMIKKFTTNMKLLDDHIVRRGYLSPPFQIIPPPLKKSLIPLFAILFFQTLNLVMLIASTKSWTMKGSISPASCHGQLSNY